MSIRNASKDSERKSARFFLIYDGESSGVLKTISTSTGRVGHLTALEFDFASKHYIGENKYSTRKAKNPSVRLTKEFVKKIESKAKAYEKELVLVAHIADCEPLHCITRERHAWLISCEQYIEENKLEDFIKDKMEKKDKGNIK